MNDRPPAGGVPTGTPADRPLLFEPRPPASRPPYPIPRMMVRLTGLFILVLLSGPLVAPRSEYDVHGPVRGNLAPYVNAEMPCRSWSEVDRVAHWGALELPFHARTAATADVNRNEKALDRLVALLDAPTGPALLSSPSLGTATAPVSLLLARGYLRQAKGEVEPAVTDWISTMRFGRVMARGTIYGLDFPVVMQGLQVEIAACRALTALLDEGHPPADPVNRIRAELALYRPPSSQAIWESSCREMHALIDEYARSNRLGSSRAYLGESYLSLRWFLPWVPWRRAAVAARLHAILQAYQDALWRQYEESLRPIDPLQGRPKPGSRTTRVNPTVGPPATLPQLMGVLAFGYRAETVVAPLLVPDCLVRLVRVKALVRRCLAVDRAHGELRAALDAWPDRRKKASTR